MSTLQDQFFAQTADSLTSETFIGVLLTKAVDPLNASQRVSASIKVIREQPMLQLLSMEKTQHTTKNYSMEEGVAEMAALCGSVFKHAILYTTEGDTALRYNKKMRPQLSRSKASKVAPASHDHDQVRQRYVCPETSLYLFSLGVTTRDGQICRNMEAKFRQIDRYVETFDAVYRKSGLASQKSLSIVDMGSGKGYLTFALYDFLCHQKGIDCSLTGVEQRQHLVDKCNTIASEAVFEKLTFIQGGIEDFEATALDVLIALHACDTATDDAIAVAIEAGASIIITAPCCHKQVRNEMDPPYPLSEIARHGIFMERQSEILTDTLRALILEAYGYETTIREFIADAHTHKNVMIVATKREERGDVAAVLKRIDELKSAFGVKRHYLEHKLSTLALPCA